MNNFHFHLFMQLCFSKELPAHAVYVTLNSETLKCYLL